MVSHNFRNGFQRSSPSTRYLDVLKHCGFLGFDGIVLAFREENSKLTSDSHPDLASLRQQTKWRGVWIDVAVFVALYTILGMGDGA